MDIITAAENFGNLLSGQDAMRQRVASTIDEIRERDFTGEAEDIAVTATVSGFGALRAINIGILAKRETDNETLGEAVVEAVRRAEATAKEALTEGVLDATHMRQFTDCIDPAHLGRFLGGPSRRLPGR